MDCNIRSRLLRRHAGLLVLIALASVLPWVSARAASTWTFVAPMSTARAGHGAAAYSGRVYVAGGASNGVNVTNSVEASSQNYLPTFWTNGGVSAMPELKAEHGMVELNGRIYAIGGWNGSVRNTVLSYNVDGSTWSPVAPLNTGRRGLAAATSGGLIYAIGGATSDGIPQTIVEVYDPVTNFWSDAAPMNVARYGPAATTGLDGRVYVIGGQADDGSSLASAEVYDPDTNTWSFIASMSYGRFGAAAVTGNDGKLYALGGSLGAAGVTNTVEAYHPNTNTWAFVAPMNSQRFYPAAAVRDGWITVCGGSNPSSGTLNSAEGYLANRPPSLFVSGTISVSEDAANTSLSISGVDPDNDPLTISVDAIPAAEKGVVRLAGGGAAITPGQTLTLSQVTGLEYDVAPNATGSAGDLQLTVTDGQGGSASRTVAFTITPVNDAPLAAADADSVPEDGILDVDNPGVLSNDVDIEGDPLTAVKVTDPAHGALTLFGDGSYLYQPDPNYSGADSFTYRARDPSNALSTAVTVSLSITPINDAPTASGQSQTTPEDTARAITLVGTDPDSDPLTYTIETPPAHGVLSGSGASRAYTPAANYNGPDSFTFKVSDGAVDSNTATVTLTVSPVADAPVAAGDSVTLVEDTPAAVTLVGSDPDGSPVSYSIVTQPAHGALSGSGANRTFTPAANYFGDDSFTFRVNDGASNSNIATVNLSITPVNDAPVAAGQTQSTPEDTAKAITLAATDADGDPLTYELVTDPIHGTVSGTGASRIYMPAAGYNGSDSFTFKANDGTVDGNTATVSITMSPVNDAPIAEGSSVTLAEDTSALIAFSGGDADGDPLTYSIVAAPAYGSLSGSGSGRTYTPAANYTGPDTFTFRVSDGALNATATVDLTVTPVNDAPVAVNGSITLTEDTPTSLTLAANDVDGDALTFSIVTPPSHGSLPGSGSSRTYTPAAGYNGPDTFTFRVSDGTLDSNTATVSLTVIGVNDAPLAANQPVTTAEDTIKAITLSAMDPDGDPLTYLLVTNPVHGTVTGSGSSRMYTPVPHYSGPDSFTFKANDGTVDGNIATVSITVTPVNDAPTATGAVVTLSEDSPTVISLAGSDPEGDALTFSIVTPPMHGSLSGSGAGRTYSPTGNYNGADTFTFRVSDGLLESSTATVSVTVTPVNDAPVAVSEAVSVLEDTAIPITLAAADADGDSLTYALVSAPTHGLLTGSGANRTYTPLNHYNGPDTLTFRASDGIVDSNTATVTLTVAAVTDSPAADDDAYNVIEDTPLVVSSPGVLDNDSTGEGGTLAAVKLTSPTHGAVALNADGTFTYTPAANYNGPDSFTYRAREGQANSSPATVTLTVAAVNDAPAAVDSTVFVAEDSSGQITLSAADPEGDAITYTVVGTPTQGALTGSGSTRTYTPAANFVGSDTITFRASDGAATGNLAVVTITVTNVNDAPIANAGAAQTLEATGPTTSVSLNGSLSSDLDGPTLTYTWSLGATQLGAGVTLNAALPVGQHTVGLTVTDPSGAGSSDTVSITVRDTTAPALTLPTPPVVPQSIANGAVVTFTVTGTDTVSAVTVVASPASGAVFPLGLTTVNVTGTDVAGNQNTGSFVVTVVAPASSTGKLTAKGTILVDGKKAKLTLTAQQVSGRPLKGSLSFTDPVTRQTVKSTRITALVIEGTRARVFGEGKLPDRTIVRFMAEAEDLGATPAADRFRLELSDGRQYGGAPLSSGSVTIIR